MFFLAKCSQLIAHPQVHYIAWGQKKTLNLSHHKEKPMKPINPADLQEIKFLNIRKQKFPDFNPKEELEMLVGQQSEESHPETDVNKPVPQQVAEDQNA